MDDQDVNRVSNEDAGQGDKDSLTNQPGEASLPGEQFTDSVEQQAEPYRQHGEGAAVETAQPTSASGDSSMASSAGQNSGAVGKSVLCIEDEFFISELYERALVRAGYRVNIIIDGPAGLAEAQTNKYDIILLDIMLPNMSGLEVLNELRDRRKTPELKSKIIITTNLDQGEEGRAAVENKADGYIVKAEITPRQLVEFLQQLNV